MQGRRAAARTPSHLPHRAGGQGLRQRRQIEGAGAAPNIAPKVNRRWTPCFSPVQHHGRNAIECMFRRFKDLRYITTRYDRYATNYLAAVCLAVTMSYQLCA